MTIKDQVSMLLTQYGYSLQEGMELYTECENNQYHEIVKINPEKNHVVWMSIEDGRCNLTIWKNYRYDFCLNYTLAGAVALNDEELAITDEEEKSLMLEFMKNCQESRNERTMPMLPEKLHWLFTSAGTTNYVSSEEFEVSESTYVKVTLK